MKKNKLFLTLLLSLFLFNTIAAQTFYDNEDTSLSIHYYGIKATELDSNMAKMISDLYYTQLSELQNYNVTDERTDSLLNAIPDKNNFSNNSFCFYVQISKINNSDKWETKFYLQNNEKDEVENKEYESFYKILMEPKNTLQATLSQLLSSTNQILSKSDQKSEKTITNSISTDFLAGTWSGEENINKIIIMRSGRGFVIFNNGASMNINIQITKLNSKNQIIITQQGKSNASFFPELPRNVALNVAKSANPIKWIFTLSDNDTLTGIKNTISLSNNDQTIPTETNVSWIRKSQ